MTKNYIRIWYPGLLFSEDSIKEIEGRPENPDIGERAYGYQFFDRESATVNGETLLGEPKNHSPTYYIGQELSAEQAIRESNSTARVNIEANGYERLVKTRTGNLFPLRAGDVVRSSL